MSNKSKRLAFLLRHDKTYEFELGGWRSVKDLVANHGFSGTELDNIVATDSKGRYELSPDKSLIRARWGHSVPVEFGDECSEVPDILYHGTADIYLLSIQKEGIRRKNRQFVHLTDDRILAMETGKRHGNPVIMTVDAKRMKKDGVLFWKRGDRIWLTQCVAPHYLLPDTAPVPMRYIFLDNG